MTLSTWLDRLPLIAILRGVTPDEVVPIARALAEEGFAIVEVPLNSPDPFESLRRLALDVGDSLLCGAGTVLTVDDAHRVAEAGGKIVVMPHADTAVIAAAKAAGLYCTPGIATPTEGFAALAAGADGLKLFPAEAQTPSVLKAMRAVFPKDVPFLPVGGIAPNNMGPWRAAGATGFGLGSALYKPGMGAEEVRANARAFVSAWRQG
ncbi:2-dehydro-3-deoxy-6-phosphogalactonate aldolase [Falsirhodobacter sp. 20TX0035]|uniref:2-dehydro-3-deoxy-6-phosphogalactonate aldolase n=1 Tax=Falsirhodobacter sp. 20TX0035 TaxID=3022019 RepID=UPI002330CD26|nr:2-dehydro-3-deoxy-6-phosphogalactonate aldolase [Falsirhodobacter sp. 20TX0035]MDB6452948.1 2-dehydro-3-deoxy-6-phosphogalactonate aldolase [Falsirhodobacter sp. 20TX0035]